MEAMAPKTWAEIEERCFVDLLLKLPYGGRLPLEANGKTYILHRIDQNGRPEDIIRFIIVDGEGGGSITESLYVDEDKKLIALTDISTSDYPSFFGEYAAEIRTALEKIDKLENERSKFYRVFRFLKNRFWQD